MPLIIAIALLSLLKYLEVGFLTEMSWWWVAGMMACAFVWFELIEPALGLDKRRAHNEIEKAREARLRKAFEQNRPKRR